jgi:hypothetical protein
MNRTFWITLGIAGWVLACVATAQAPADPPIESIEFFNGRNFDGLKVYSEDQAIDVAEMWQSRRWLRVYPEMIRRFF